MTNEDFAANFDGYPDEEYRKAIRRCIEQGYDKTRPLPLLKAVCQQHSTVDEAVILATFGFLTVNGTYVDTLGASGATIAAAKVDKSQEILGAFARWGAFSGTPINLP